MFKSSEKLRHEAAQRSLDRVASSWRSARTTWFDGTPESIEARLAATERVLAVARSGYSPAHLELTVEAENARRELREASHRLLIDFLDDGARAFKGSKRVADGRHDVDPVAPWKNTIHEDRYWDQLPVSDFADLYTGDGDPVGKHRAEAAKERGLRECINCGGSLSGEEDDDKDSECGHCGESAHEPRGGRTSHIHEGRAPEENENFEEGANYADYYGKCTRCKSDNIDSTSTSGEYDCWDCGATFHPKVRKLKSSIHEGYGRHNFEDEIDRAYENGGRLDYPMVNVDTAGGGIFRNHPGMIDGYDEGPYMGSQYGYDAASDPDFAEADYLGPAGRDMGGKHRAEAGLYTAGLGVVWEGKACPDCAMAINNGDDSAASDEWSWDKLENGIAGLPGDKHPVISCPDCDEGSHGFSRGPCDLCGSPYDNQFHRVVTLGHEGQ